MATAAALLLAIGAAAQEDEHEGFSAAECVAWVDATYRMASMAQGFGLDLSAEIAENRACMEHDTQRMALPIPQTWCDNVFKIHCSGLDLVAEIGDAMVDRCEKRLSDSLGFDVGSDKTWNVCGEQKVFDAYSMKGTVSDEAACRKILVEECGAEIEESGPR